MNCPSTEELTALFDGTLPAERATRIRSHLAFCQRCCHDIDVVSRLLDGPHSGNLPGDLRDKLARRLDASGSSIRIRSSSAPRPGRSRHPKK